MNRNDSNDIWEAVKIYLGFGLYIILFIAVIYWLARACGVEGFHPFN